MQSQRMEYFENQSHSFLVITTARAPVMDMKRVWLRPISSAMCMKRSTMLTVIIAAPAHASMKAVSGTSIAALPDPILENQRTSIFTIKLLVRRVCVLEELLIM